MPHRNVKAVLRPPTPKKAKQSEPLVAKSKTQKPIKTMTTMELLGHGLATTLHRKQGWLKELLLAEGNEYCIICNEIISSNHNTLLHQGILEDKPEALKLRVGYDYNNQIAFIEGMIPSITFISFACYYTTSPILCL